MLVHFQARSVIPEAGIEGAVDVLGQSERASESDNRVLIVHS